MDSSEYYSSSTSTWSSSPSSDSSEYYSTSTSTSTSTWSSSPSSDSSEYYSSSTSTSTSPSTWSSSPSSDSSEYYSSSSWPSSQPSWDSSEYNSSSSSCSSSPISSDSSEYSSPSSSSSSSSSDSSEYNSSDYEDHEQPQIKRQKLSLPPRTQICIVAELDTTLSQSYDIIVADLDSLRNAASFSDSNSDFFPMRPTLRLKVHRHSPHMNLSFAGLGSKLYIFESTPFKSVYTIDLSPYSSSDLPTPTLAFRTKELTKAPDMWHPKMMPSSIPTPDGKKILVFSSLIKFTCSDSPYKTNGDHDFELFDPHTNTWQKLPGIHYNYHRPTDHIMICSFAFIGTSTFFLETDYKLMFTLNLESIDKGWQKINTFFGTKTASHDLGRPFLVMEEELCVTPYVAYDVKNEEEYTFPFHDDLEDLNPPFVAVLGSDNNNNNNNNGIHNFCTLKCLEISRRRRYPHLILNLVSCNLSKYREDKEERGDLARLSPSMRIGESFNFYMEKRRTLLPRCLFSFCS